MAGQSGDGAEGRTQRSMKRRAFFQKLIAGAAVASLLMGVKPKRAGWDLANGEDETVIGYWYPNPEYANAQHELPWLHSMQAHWLNQPLHPVRFNVRTDSGKPIPILPFVYYDTRCSMASVA